MGFSVCKILQKKTHMQNENTWFKNVFVLNSFIRFDQKNIIKFYGLFFLFIVIWIRVNVHVFGCSGNSLVQNILFMLSPTITISFQSFCFLQ